MVDEINRAMLPWWRTVAPTQVRHAVGAAASRIGDADPILAAVEALAPALALE